MELSKRQCEQCGKDLEPGRQRFCSTNCQANNYYHTVVKPAVSAAKETRPPRVCELCGKEFSAKAHGRRRFCSDGCEQKAYNRTRRARPISPADVERYWALVDRRGLDECWMWKGRLDEDGYGVCSAGARQVRAHRLGWILAHPEEELTPEQVVRHSCDHPACQNDQHLLRGSNAENVADMLSRGRNSTGEGRPASKLTRAAVVEIAAQYATGKFSQQQLADQYEVSRTVVGSIVRGEGWKAIQRVDTTAVREDRKKNQPYHVRGSSHPLAALTEEKVREIRRRYAAGGVTQGELALEYGVDRTNISNVVRRKTWTHIE